MVSQAPWTYVSEQNMATRVLTKTVCFLVEGSRRGIQEESKAATAPKDKPQVTYLLQSHFPPLDDDI